MGQAGSNSLHVQTDQPTYVAGQSVTGKVFLSNASPINSRGIFLKVQGYEKVRFVEHKTRQVRALRGHHCAASPRAHPRVWHCCLVVLFVRQVRDGEHMRTETYEVERKNKRVFFNQTFPVYTWQGPIPPGQYTFPFNFQLPVQLPGVYWENTYVAFPARDCTPLTCHRSMQHPRPHALRGPHPVQGEGHGGLHGYAGGMHSQPLVSGHE